ncbi:sugar phosphate isomerase/epimerase family protein [Methanobrevibacter sp. DSM 116169]|uniref:sugar phosphate isomerase/epimerase family protein n=1 Tax=Methanobrevibacter sp. DSM 116169 TaxID=3242727 RepID=UPI0038FD2C6E
MKIGASTLSIYGEDIEQNLKYFESLNIEYLEILHQYPCEEINTEVLNSYNLNYTVHSPIIDLNIASLNTYIYKSSIEAIKSSADFANKIDSEILVVHPGIIPYLARDYEKEVYEKSHPAIKEISKYCDDLGITAAIENMPNIEGFMYQDIEKLDEFLKSYNLAMTLDIGHAYTAGYSENQMYFDSIKHIHMSDNYGDNDSHLALGDGEIDFNNIINVFKKKNYNGIYMIEVNNTDYLEKSLEYIKKL